MTDREALDAVRIAALLAKADAGEKIELDDCPPVESVEQKSAYGDIAARLYSGLDGPPEERARTPRGQLASVLWQRIAEWDDAVEEAKDG